MKEQNLENHARLHPPYHFLGSLLCMFTLIGSLVYLIQRIIEGEGVFQALLLFTGSLGLVITFALVRVYALQNQDRIIRVEENMRSYLLTGKQLDPRLTIKQIIALRFASDNEFSQLTVKAVEEKLSPADIKKSVKAWRADHQRV